MQDTFGGPRPSDMARAAAFISYWVAPILFGLFLLISAISLKRKGGEKIVRATLMVLAIINITWPIALASYAWTYSAIYMSQEDKRERQAEADTQIRQQAEERLRRLAQIGEEHGCKSQPLFSSSDHSYRIQDYIEKVEAAHAVSVYEEILPGLRQAWEECAVGTISPQQYNEEYKVLVAQKASELFKQKFGQSEFVKLEQYYKALQEKSPDRYVY